MEQRRYRSARAGLVPLALLVAACGVAPALAQDRTTLFVLDASRSMKSTVDGKSKISHAREVLAEVSQGPRRALGLVTFGSRDASSCTDVGVAAPLGGEPSAFRAALDAVEPTGVAPIGEAVRVAFEAALKGAKPTTLVLIADGPDTCNANLCAAAKSMKEQAPSLQIHAIGFVSSEPRKFEAIACLAEATGGRFTLARGRAGLAQAVADAIGGAGPNPSNQMAAKPSDMAPLSVAAKPEQALGVQASAFQSPRTDPSHAVLAKAPAAAVEVPREAPTASWAPKPILSLAPTGLNAFAARPRTDAATSHGQPRPPNDGLPKVPVSLAAALADQLPMLKEGVLWRVFSAVKDASGAHPLVTESAQSAPMLSLAPGDYIVHCAYGRAQATKQIRVGGGPAYHRLVLGAGALRLSAMVGQTGTVPADLVSFAIYRGDPEATRENMLVVPAARPGRIIRLGEGTYHVVSRYGDGNALVRANVRVEAGRLTDAIIHHKAARITLKLVGEPGGEAIANTSWSIKMKGAGETVQESIGAFPSHVLAAGEYTVIARHDARTFQRDFRVEPGPDREIEVLAR